MKKILLLSMTAAVLLSCTKEQQESEIVPNGSGNGIAFNIATFKSGNTKSTINSSSQVFAQDGVIITLTEECNNAYSGNSAQTKGTPIESLCTFLDKTDEFTIWGWNNGSPIAELSNPHTVKKNGSLYYPVDGSGQFEDIYLSAVSWNTPRFCALAQPEETGTLNVTSATSVNLVFNYTLPAPDPTTNCDAQVQKEILTGVFSGTTADLSNNRVPLTFDQPLAAIRFKVGDVEKEIKIKSITLEGIPSTATCTVDAETGSISWSGQSDVKTYVQEFDTTVSSSTPKGSNLNDDQLTKTFLVIPYAFSTALNQNIIIDYVKDEQDLVAKIPLRETVWEASKTYTYTIECTSGIWMDFSNTNQVGGQQISNISWEFNDHISFTYPQVEGQYEKFVIPIHGLSVGTWYNLDFTETLSPQKTKTYWNDGRGEYVCSVLETAPTSAGGCTTMITYYSNDDSETNTKYYWFGYEGYTNYTSNRKEHNILTFKATSSTMYWVWSVSACNDLDKFDITFKKNSFTTIEIPTVPAVDYLNADHYGFSHNNKGGSLGYSTFKTTASYGTSTESGQMEFHARPQESKYEKLNIPLINLVSGHKYRISFKYKFDAVDNSDYCFGFNVSNAKLTGLTKNSETTVAGLTTYMNLKGSRSKGTEYEVTYEFDATAQTMYMNWVCGGMADGGRDILKFYNTIITDITPE